MKGAALVSAKGITVEFNKHVVLDNCDLTIEKGEILGITGVSGAGKSTLINSLCGIINPIKGIVHYNAAIAGLMGAKELAWRKDGSILKRFIGYSTQTPSFYPELTIMENLLFFGEMYGVPKKIVQKNGSVLLDLLGLGKFHKKQASGLSGGMKKRLDIAAALIHNPKILFLDEPTSDLDPILRAKVWELVRKIHNQGTTIVISSHFLNELEGVCTRVAIINNGKVARSIHHGFNTEGAICWMNVEIETRNYSNIIKKIKEIKGITEEDVFEIDGEPLLIRIPNNDNFKGRIIAIGKKCGQEIKSIEPCPQPLRKIFEGTVK